MVDLGNTLYAIPFLPELIQAFGIPFIFILGVALIHSEHS